MGAKGKGKADKKNGRSAKDAREALEVSSRWRTRVESVFARRHSKSFVRENAAIRDVRFPDVSLVALSSDDGETSFGSRVRTGGFRPRITRRACNYARRRIRDFATSRRSAYVRAFLSGHGPLASRDSIRWIFVREDLISDS